MNTTSTLIEQFPPDETYHLPRTSIQHDKHKSHESGEPAHELGVRLLALRSFFRASNHPQAEAEQSGGAGRDWANEVRIARQALLRSSQLALRLIHLEGDGLHLSAESGNSLLLSGLEMANSLSAAETEPISRSLGPMAEALNDICVMCEALLEAPTVSFYSWATVGKILTRELERSESVKWLERAAHHQAQTKLPAPLLALVRDGRSAIAFESDMLIIFTDLMRLLEWLHFVETSLRHDQTLKQTLPIFCLVHEEVRALLDFIETRALRTEGLDESVFDALDGTNYAITMELRKVFSRELLGLSELRQSSQIYAKVENAHGLLRDCFQQSIVALAQLLDPTLDGERLFSTFHTKLEQSLMLRSDLWTLLQLVRRAEQERDHRPVPFLLERLLAFREGSLRYLMYKDWEACERFIEEVSIARGVVEVTPVLHRFGAYLEMLHGQVNMRAVLAEHPFDYPPLEK